MLKVADHHHLLNNQFLAQATQDTHPCNHLWTFEQQSTDRDKKMTLHASSNEEVASFLTDDLEQTLKQLHTHAVAEERAKSQQNRVLKRPPPEISKDEEELSRYDRRILCQLRSGFSWKLAETRHRLQPDIESELCSKCNSSIEDCHHLFNCLANPISATIEDLWKNPLLVVEELAEIFSE